MYGSEQDIYNITQGNTIGKHGIFTVPKGERYALLGVDVLGKTEDSSIVTVRVRQHRVGSAPLQSALGFEEVLSVNTPVNEIYKSAELAFPYMLPQGAEIEMQGTKLSGASSGFTELTATMHLVQFT